MTDVTVGVSTRISTYTFARILFDGKMERYLRGSPATRFRVAIRLGVLSPCQTWSARLSPSVCDFFSSFLAILVVLVVVVVVVVFFVVVVWLSSSWFFPYALLPPARPPVASLPRLGLS